VLIVPAGSTRETLEKRPNGTGPYAVASWEPRRRLGLRRHEGYWGRLAPHSRVEVEMSVTEEQATAGLAAHRLSLIRTRFPGTLRAAEQSPRYRVARQMSLYLLHLGFNLSSPTLPGSEGVSNPFLRREVRQAIDIALDRGQIAAAASTNAVPTARIVPDSIFGSLPRGREAVWDLKRARGLLEGVGLGGGFDVALHSVYADPYPPIEELKAQLGKIGIRVRHVSFPSVPDFFAALRRRELGFWLIADGCMTGEAGWLLASQFHSADPSRNLGTDNYSGYSNPKLDEAIERADAILNARQRLPALQEAVSLAEEELLWIPLYHNEVLFVVDRALAFEPRHDLLLRYAEIGESSSR
jgi:peptide/nickel transport system substrate-binding protein